MKPFHISLGVKSLDESEYFFKHVLGAPITHRDGDGYININFFGTQITLKEAPIISPPGPEFHFGVNLELEEFRKLAETIAVQYSEWIAAPLSVVDAGTGMERQKIYLKCPSGYLIELKGYQGLEEANK